MPEQVTPSTGDEDVTGPHLTPTPEAWAFAEREARIWGYHEGADRTSFAAGWYASCAEFAADIARLHQQLDEAKARVVMLTGFEHDYWRAQKALDEILGTEEEDGSGGGFVAEIWLVAEQRDEARRQLEAARHDADRMRPVFEAAEVWRAQFSNTPDPFPRAAALIRAVDAFRSATPAEPTVDGDR